MEQILKYFPELTEEQRMQMAQLDALYRDWNAKINVISRKDIDNLYEHHVLHSLAIAKTLHFKPGTKVLDFGTGGGFPGIPLAIMFPEIRHGTDARALTFNSCIREVGQHDCQRKDDTQGLQGFYHHSYFCMYESVPNTVLARRLALSRRALTSSPTSP